ncbi:hypothetical protein H0H87_012333 [Tephrocybe sp. NHM501043]|nr:hypothetical protein H0H87_012333 [Tephrocybe sp. NHM501043]
MKISALEITTSFTVGFDHRYPTTPWRLTLSPITDAGHAFQSPTTDVREEDKFNETPPPPAVQPVKASGPISRTGIFKPGEDEGIVDDVGRDDFQPGGVNICPTDAAPVFS